VVGQGSAAPIGVKKERRLAVPGVSGIENAGGVPKSGETQTLIKGRSCRDKQATEHELVWGKRKPAHRRLCIKGLTREKTRVCKFHALPALPVTDKLRLGEPTSATEKGAGIWTETDKREKGEKAA